MTYILTILATVALYPVIAVAIGLAMLKIAYYGYFRWLK